MSAQEKLFVGSFNDVRVTNDGPYATGSIFVQNTKKKVGFSAFALINQYGWGEVIVGPTISLTKDLNIYLQLGMETVRPWYRLAFSTFYFDGSSRFFGSIEKGDGDENYWYTATYDWQPKRVTFGAMIQRYYGVGPRIGYKFGKLWVVAGGPYDLEANEWRPTLFVNYLIQAGY